MALPRENTAWPPKPHDQVLAACRERQVWWEGDPDKLAQFYSSGQRAVGGGRFRRAWEAFWGRTQSSSEPNRIHVPIAGDIGRIAASTLFSEPPTFAVRDESQTAAQKRIDLIFNTPDTYSRLLEAGESQSMLSGVFGRCVWDSELSDHAWIDFIDADRAIPVFRWGRLVEVTFWSVLPTDDERVVWRHLEHHQSGQIVHMLFQGTDDNLGREHPLESHAATADLSPVVEVDPKRLTAAYFPNHRPAPEFRNIPELAPLGRSDLSRDMIHLLDTADEIWSSWMNDLNIGRGRLIVSEDLMRRNGPGLGSHFDLDQTVFSPVGVASQQGEATSMLEAHQFAIRVEEHTRTFENMLRRIVSRAGYSPLTFGLQDEVAITATEIEAKERDTNATRQSKIRLWSPLADLVEACLMIDAHVFDTGIPEVEIDAEFAPMHQQSERQRAETVTMWEQAQAATIDTKVRYLHPDWDERRIEAEVSGILGEQAPVIDILEPTELDSDTTVTGTVTDSDTPDSGVGGSGSADTPPIT